MNSNNKVKRADLPQHVDFREVQVGDLLFFRTPANPNSDHLLIENIQALVRGQDGHGASNHVALVVEVQVDPSGKKVPIIAHTTVRGEEGTADFAPGYIKEPLQDQIDRENDRSFVIYRPKNKEFAKNIALIAGNEKEHKNIIWEWKPAIKAFFSQFALFKNRSIELDVTAAEQVKLAQSSICTMFVVQVMKAAAKLTAHDKFARNKVKAGEVKGFLHVPDASMPKFLENHLHNHADYDRLTYLGQEPFKRLENEIRAQITRLQERHEKTKSPKEQARITEKIILITKSLDRTLAAIGDKPYRNETVKCAELLMAVMPALEMKTKFSVRKTTALKKVLGTAKSMGIFKEDINKRQKHQEMLRHQQPLNKNKKAQNDLVMQLHKEFKARKR